MNKRSLICLVSVVALVVAAGPAAGQLTIPPGSDIFTTPGGGQTTVDLSQYPLSDVFGNQNVSPQIVVLAGKPIAGLGQTDTVVDRLDSVTIPGHNQPTSVDIRLTGLSLTGSVSIDGQPWNLLVSVSPTVESTGSMTINQTSSEGGSFSATIDVYPHLIFTSSGQSVAIDCGRDCRTITLSSQGAPWVRPTNGGFSPSSAGIPNIANNTSYDGDADGVADDVYTKSSVFFPGFQPFSPYTPVPVAHDHPPVAEHTQKPNTQCKTRTVSTASSSEMVGTLPSPAPALCAAVSEPIEPTEPSDPVVVTGG